MYRANVSHRDVSTCAGPMSAIGIYPTTLFIVLTKNVAEAKLPDKQGRVEQTVLSKALIIIHIN
jgi:hypothetical protein